MRTTFKKGLIAILSLFFALSSATAQTFVDNGIYYNITSTTDLTAEVSAPAENETYSGSIVIPESVEYDGTAYAVTGIADYAFYWCYGLADAKIPSTVTYIGDYAFYDCYALTAIDLGSSVKTIGDEAFAYCFALTSITLPNSLESLGYAVFNQSTLLTEIVVADGCENYCSDENGVLFNGDKTSLIQYPAGSNLSSYDIPNSVTSIEDYAFYWADGLKTINFGNAVSTIGNQAFYYCTRLTSVELPNSLTYIGEEAFYYCKKLTSVDIPDNVTAIGSGAFSVCNALTSVRIGDAVTSIGDAAFSYCESLQSVEIGGAVGNIGDEAFYSCTSMERFTVSEDNKYYSSDEYGAFFNKDKTTLIQYPAGSSMVSYDIPETVTYLESHSFESSSNLTTVGIPTSVTAFGYQVFCSCKALKSIVLPNSLTRLEESTFWECTALESAEIPASVTVIGDYAFAYCSSLVDVTSLNPEPPVCEDTDVFFDVDKVACILTVPAGAADAYADADVWNEFTNIKEQGSSDIENVGLEGSSKITNRYGLDGKEVNSAHKGINIVRYSDGSAKKILVK